MEIRIEDKNVYGTARSSFKYGGGHRTSRTKEGTHHGRINILEIDEDKSARGQTGYPNRLEQTTDLAETLLSAQGKKMFPPGR